MLGFAILYKVIGATARLRGYLSRALKGVREHVLGFSKRDHDGERHKGKVKSQECL